MKILGFEFRKFDKKSTTINYVETWCVSWYRLHHDIGRFWHPSTQIMSFTSKEDAEVFAKELKDAVRLLKNDHQRVEVYKQIPPSNL